MSILEHVPASTPVQFSCWYTPLLSGVFALVGVLIAQGVVLYLAHRNDKRRSEPELLRHCAEFSAASGRLKRELSLKEPADREAADLAALRQRIEASTVAHARSAVGSPSLPAQLDLTVTTKQSSRVS